MKMKVAIRPLVVFLGLTLTAAWAADIKVNLSPPGTDSAVGLSTHNETPPPTNSTGSGNAISGGLVLHTTGSNSILDFAIGYGSAAGFSNLTGPAVAAHIHGPAPTNTPAGILISLEPFHFPSINPSNGGILFGSVTLTSQQTSNLLSGLLYVNIHTASNQSGEIRGQLIAETPPTNAPPTNAPPTNTAPNLVCPGNATLECTGQPVSLTAHVSDAQGDALKVVWTVNGTVIKTNQVPQGSGSSNGVDVVLAVNLPSGTNHVGVAVSDSGTNQTSCTSTIIIKDTTPPGISGLAVYPSTLWPPNHTLVPIRVTVQPQDNCCATTWKILSVTSNEQVGSGADPFVQWLRTISSKGNGSGNTAPDWVITGDHTVSLRAERSGNGNGRIYKITVQATDCAGMVSETKTLRVTVAHDQGHEPVGD